jgi:hypothetical protein
MRCFTVTCENLWPLIHCSVYRRIKVLYVVMAWMMAQITVIEISRPGRRLDAYIPYICINTAPMYIVGRVSGLIEGRRRRFPTAVILPSPLLHTSQHWCDEPARPIWRLLPMIHT